MNDQQRDAIENLVTSGMFPEGLLAVSPMPNGTIHLCTKIPKQRIDDFAKDGETHPLQDITEALEEGLVFDDEDEWNLFTPEPEPSG